MAERLSGWAAPDDPRITCALHEAADRIELPNQFLRPRAAVSAATSRQRKIRGRILSIAAAFALIIMTTGAAIAAKGGWPWPWTLKEPPTTADLELARQTLEDENQALAHTVETAEATAPEMGQLSFSYPVSPPTITGPFGPRSDASGKEATMHTGIDFSAQPGDAIHAAADGVVTAAGSYPALGNVVVITHGKVNGAPVSTWYEYLGELKVQVGQSVQHGGVIAMTGVTGAVSGPHLHFEVRKSGRPVDPMDWIKP